MAEAPAYLRVARDGAWWKLLLEVVLAIVWWAVSAGVVSIVVLSIAGAKSMEELDILSNLLFIHIMLALMTPAALAAAHVIGRRSQFLFSIAGRLRFSWLLRCAAFALGCQLAFVGLALLSELLSTGDITSLSNGGPRFLQVVAITIVLVPFQAMGEEMFNRGTIQQVVGGWGAPVWLAILLSTAAFVAMHGKPNVGTIAIAAMGISYAWLTLETGGLEAAIAGHAVNNVVAFILGAAAHGEKSLDPREHNESVGWASVVVQLVTIALYVYLVRRAWKRSTSQGSATR